MAIKSFNLSEEAYGAFAAFCKKRGLSMSRQVEFFIESFIGREPVARKEYLERLAEIRRRDKFVRVADFGQRYGLTK